VSGWERVKLILVGIIVALSLLKVADLVEWQDETDRRLASIESRIPADAAAFEKLKLEAARGELAAKFIEQRANQAVKK
jgi:hypothetical protein